MRTFKTFMAVAMVAVAAMCVEPAFAQSYSKKEKKEKPVKDGKKRRGIILTGFKEKIDGIFEFFGDDDPQPIAGNNDNEEEETEEKA